MTKLIPYRRLIWNTKSLYWRPCISPKLYLTHPVLLWESNFSSFQWTHFFSWYVHRIFGRKQNREQSQGGVNWYNLGLFGTVLRGNLEQGGIRITKWKKIIYHKFSGKFNFLSLEINVYEQILIDCKLRIYIWNMFQITPWLLGVLQFENGQKADF